MAGGRGDKSPGVQRLLKDTDRKGRPEHPHSTEKWKPSHVPFDFFLLSPSPGSISTNWLNVLKQIMKGLSESSKEVMDQLSQGVPFFLTGRGQHCAEQVSASDGTAGGGV